MTDYNPADHSVADVKAHLEKNPQDLNAVLEAEKARGDSARSTLVSSLEEQAKAVPEAVEPKPVEVAPGPTPTHSFFGKDYVRTPDGGFRSSQG